ncbi:MAG: hypothetical protein Q4C00_06700 [Bacillota bacterium]|nr:hypothetical protein [Bacillota bacterium]
MNENTSFTIGTGLTRLNFRLIWQGSDIYITITGGSEHIGSVAVVMAGGINILTASGHKDDFLVRPIAEAVAVVFKGTAVIMAGFHLDNITSQQIEAVLANNREGVNRLKAYLLESRSSRSSQTP